MPNPRFASLWRRGKFAQSPRLLLRVVGPGDFLFAVDESDPGEWPMSRPSRPVPHRIQGCVVATSSVSVVCSLVPSSSSRCSGSSSTMRQTRAPRSPWPASSSACSPVASASGRGCAPRCGRQPHDDRAPGPVTGPRHETRPGAADEGVPADRAARPAQDRAASPSSWPSRRSGSPASSTSGAWRRRSPSAWASASPTTSPPSSGCSASSPMASSPRRATMMRSTLVRLLVLTVVAVVARRGVVAGRHRAAAGPRGLPAHRPGDDHHPAA